MSTRIEWMDAADVEVAVLAPGEDWIGADDHAPDAHVLTLAVDEVTAIEGSLAALLVLADRIRRAVYAALAAEPDDPAR